MKIKICGIKYKENLQEVIKLMPDFLGFNYYPLSPRYICNNLTPSDLAVIPPNIKKTGIFVNQDEFEVSGIKRRYDLDYVQLHGNENPDVCKGLKSNGIKLIKAFRIDRDFNFNTLVSYMPWCDYFLFDSQTLKYGGSGYKFDWKLLERYNLDHPFFLSGGIKPEDAESLKGLSFSSLAGVDINSGFESEPGIKDAVKLREFFRVIRQFA